MQAYKIKGKIDTTGNLLINEPINLPAGDVELIVLKTVDTVDNTIVLSSEPAPKTPKRKSRIKALQRFFENSPPVPPDFDPDQAKWEYLKEKHNV